MLMKYRLLGVLFTILAAVGAIAPALGLAEQVSEPLSYEGQTDPTQLDSNSAQPASSRLVPVSYGADYSTQFPAAASFMQSPYSSGGVQSLYGEVGSGAPSAAGYGSVAPPPANVDPFGASEVSPFSRYSPYMEILGEGSTYTLGIDDVVTIIVRQQPDFSGRFVIDPEGNIQYPFVGDIAAVGLTKGELKKEVLTQLRKFIRYPEVAVLISEYRSKAVYVFGHVGRPGKFAMKGDKITVKEAVVAAGLPTGDAALGRVYVIRPSEFTDDAKPRKTKVDLNKLLNKGISAEDFILEPGDTIIVKQRYFDKFVNNFSRLVGPLFQAAAVYELGFGTQDGLLAGD